MRAIAIFLGSFWLFSLTFVGGIGPFYTESAVISGISIVLSGILLFGKGAPAVAFWLAMLSSLTYLPVIYQRFSWEYGPDWAGVPFDILNMAFLMLFLHRYRPGSDKG